MNFEFKLWEMKEGGKKKNVAWLFEFAFSLDCDKGDEEEENSENEVNAIKKKKNFLITKKLFSNFFSSSFSFIFSSLSNVSPPFPRNKIVWRRRKNSHMFHLIGTLWVDEHEAQKVAFESSLFCFLPLFECLPFFSNVSVLL